MLDSGFCGTRNATEAHTEIGQGGDFELKLMVIRERVGR